MKIPQSPFATRLSGSAKETELRLRSIFQWKKKRPPVILIVLAVLVVAGCGGLVRFQNPAPENLAQENTADITQDQDEDTVQNEAVDAPRLLGDPVIMEAYQEVLRGDKEFFNTTSNETVGIDRLNQTITSAHISATVKQFAVVDLDHDNIPEVILWLSTSGNDYAGFEILRWQDGVIEGYTLVYRAFMELKADGTFSFSGGAFNHGVGTIMWTEEDPYLVDRVIYCVGTETYFVDRESATADAFGAAIYQQDVKPAAAWYAFTEDNVERIAAEDAELLPLFDIASVEGMQAILDYYQQLYQPRRVYFRGAEPGEPQEGDFRIELVNYVGETRLYEAVGAACEIIYSDYTMRTGRLDWQESQSMWLVISHDGYNDGSLRVLGAPSFNTDGMAVEDIIQQTARGLFG